MKHTFKCSKCPMTTFKDYPLCHRCDSPMEKIKADKTKNDSEKDSK